MTSPADRRDDKNVRVPDGFEAETDRNPHLTKSRPSRATRLALFALVAAAVVMLDQLSKLAARSALVSGEPVTLIPGVMDLSLIYNTGAAFSMGEGAGPLFVLIAAVAALAVNFVCFFFF